MTIAYTVAASSFVLLELNSVFQLLGWNISELAGITNAENYVAIWEEANQETSTTTAAQRALRLQLYWNAMNKTTLCGVVISTIISSDPLVRCTACVMICMGVSQYHYAMRPTLIVMEENNEIVPLEQHKAIDALVAVLFISFATIALWEGNEYVGKWTPNGAVVGNTKIEDGYEENLYQQHVDSTNNSTKMD